MPGTYTLYIHASNNVIEPLAIQLDVVEHAINVAWNLPPGRAMAEEVVAQITRAFPKARAAEQMAAIEALLKFMNRLSGAYLEGLVLRVPGIIDPPPRPASAASANNTASTSQLQQQVNLLTQQYQQQLAQQRSLYEAERKRLEQELSSARQQLQQLLPLKASARRLHEVEKLYQEAQLHLQDYTHHIRDLDTQLQQCKRDLDAEIQTNGALHIECDQHKATNEQLHKDIAEHKQMIQVRMRNSQQDQREIAKLQKKLKDMEDERNYYKKLYDDTQKVNTPSKDQDSRYVIWDA